MSNELKKCPFCGATPYISSTRSLHKLMADHDEDCVFDANDTTLAYFATESGLKQMIESWNRRDGDSAEVDQK